MAVQQLPIGNRRIFQRVIELLFKVAEKSHINKMEAKNLAIIFSPTFLRSTSDNLQEMLNQSKISFQVIEFCILYHDSIFSEVIFIFYLI